MDFAPTGGAVNNGFTVNGRLDVFAQAKVTRNGLACLDNAVFANFAACAQQCVVCGVGCNITHPAGPAGVARLVQQCRTGRLNFAAHFFDRFVGVNTENGQRARVKIRQGLCRVRQTFCGQCGTALAHVFQFAFLGQFDLGQRIFDKGVPDAVGDILAIFHGRFQIFLFRIQIRDKFVVPGRRGPFFIPGRARNQTRQIDQIFGQECFARGRVDVPAGGIQTFAQIFATYRGIAEHVQHFLFTGQDIVGIAFLVNIQARHIQQGAAFADLFPGLFGLCFV